MSSSRSTWESIRLLFSPKTIPFLISQGVVPKLFPVLTLLVGMILAFAWAYGISPAVYTNAEPVNMGPSWKQEYVKQVAWQFAATGDGENARRQLSYIGNAPDVVALMLSSVPQGDPLLEKLVAIQPLAEPNPNLLSKVSPSFPFRTDLTPLFCVLGLAILLGLPVIVNTLIPVTLLFQRRIKGPITAQSVAEKERRVAMERAKEAAKVAPPPPAPGQAPAVDRGTPVGQYMSTYIIGDDLYDDSFSIETASGEFLGETGAGISKTIGVGEPKKVTAIECWVFDKNDIRTVTKVLMSEHAFNDDAIRAELAPKGEAVPIKSGGIVLLETQTLTVQARVIDLAYGSGALPANSFFERVSVEISAWPKKVASAGPAAGAFGETGPFATRK